MPYKFHEAAPSIIHDIEAIIKQYYPILHEANIAVVLHEDEKYRPRRPRFYGKAQLVPAQFSPWMEADYLFTINEDEWLELSDPQRQALLDHLLCGCGINPTTEAWTLIQPDVVEYSEVIARRGFWNPDLDRAAQAQQTYMQQRLPGVDNAKPAGRGHVVTVTGDQLEKLTQGAANV